MQSKRSSCTNAVLANAGIMKPPTLDWFHIAMRLQHTKLAAANLSTDDHSELPGQPPHEQVPADAMVATGR